MPLRVLFLLMLSCCLLAGPAQALDPDKAFRHYVRDTWSVQEGLPQAAATAIAQTPDGYLWVGTQAGLARFDGVAFTTFSPSNEPALPNPIIMALAVDGDGALWIGTRGGLAVYRDGRFQTVPFGEDGEEVFIYALRVSGDGRVWAATDSGVASVEQGRLVLLPDNANAIAIAVAGDGTIWAGQRGVTHWNGQQWSEPGYPGSRTTWVTGLLAAGDEVWAATHGGLHVQRGSGWQPVPGASGPEALPAHFVYRDRDGNIWAGGDQGLVRIRPDGEVETIRATRTNGLSGLFTAFEDREGNLWLGSQGHGLTRLRNGWTRRYSIEEGLPNAATWTLAPDPGGDGILVGTSSGLARLDDQGRFSPIASGSGAADPVIALFPFGDAVWIGRSATGLEVYAPGHGPATTKPEWARQISGSVMGFSDDADGHLWIGSMGNLKRWDGSAITEFDASHGLVGTLVEPRLVTLQDGRRLVLTETGLLEFDGQAFRPAAEAVDLPEGVNLHGLVELSDGRLLLTELDGPLLLRHRDRWHRIDEAAGLVPGIAFQVIERAGTLWISSASGVYRLQVDDLTALAEGRIERLHPDALVDERGLSNGSQPGVCCNGSPGPHDGFIADDVLWTPTSDGVLAVDINDIVRNPVPAGVHVGRVLVGEQWRNVPPGGNATFDAGERALTLAFDVLSFQDPRSNQARYRLLGYEQEWQTAAAMVREVRYTNLSPGDYTFEVMGSNNAGVWSTGPARLEFSIQPHLHETLAFRLLLAALGALLVYAGYRYQRLRYHRRQARLEALVGERTEALAESNQELARIITRLEEANVTDPLTGLRNRRYLTQQLPVDLTYYDRQTADTRQPSEAVVFAMLDLDHFKQVNDTYGHATGDRVLEETAHRLKALVRAGDYVVRWGGEEFLLVFRPMPADRVPVMGERLRAAIADTSFNIGEGRGLKLTASVGLSEYPLFRDAGHALDWEAMIELADQALYYVKRHGRDGWALFRPTPTTRLESLVSDLQRDPDALLGAGALELVGSMGGHEAPVSADPDAVPDS